MDAHIYCLIKVDASTVSQLNDHYEMFARKKIETLPGYRVSPSILEVNVP